MARKIDAYACEFGCRRRILSSSKAMERHEKTCKLNPDRRSCPTCIHQGHDIGDEPDYSSGYPGSPSVYFCDIDKLPGDKQMVFNCEFWEPK